MYEKYKELFQRYLKICKSKYDDGNPYDNLEDCCIDCNRFKEQLTGMLYLMRETNVITEKQERQEFDLILKTFSTIDLFNYYMDGGEVWVYRKAEE